MSDGGYVTEASILGDGRGCTRAGKAMVIDYIFVGSLHRQADPVDPGAVTVTESTRGVKTSAVRVVSAKQAASASDPKCGVKFAVQEFGSDHLPVRPTPHNHDACTHEYARSVTQ